MELPADNLAAPLRGMAARADALIAALARLDATMAAALAAAAAGVLTDTDTALAVTVAADALALAAAAAAQVKLPADVLAAVLRLIPAPAPEQRRASLRLVSR